MTPRRSTRNPGPEDAAADDAAAEAPAISGTPAPSADTGEDTGEGGGRGLLTLRLGDARFGVWVDEVLEIVETPPISRLPLTRAEVAGVTSVRGDVVPVLDFGLRLLGAPAARPGRLVLVRHQASGTMVALLVDAVEALLTITEDRIQPPPSAAEARLKGEVATGVVTTAEEDVVTILHLGRATAPPDPSTDES